MRTLTRTIPLVGDPGAASGIVVFGTPPAKLHGIQVRYHEQPQSTCLTVMSMLNGLEKTILTLTEHNDAMPLQSVGESVLDDLGAPTEVLVPPIVTGTIIVTVTAGNPDPVGVHVTLVIEN